MTTILTGPTESSSRCHVPADFDPPDEVQGLLTPLQTRLFTRR